MAIRVFESFSGYGSQSVALDRLRRDYPSVEYEIVGISEIDKYAIEAYNALHPNVTNYGDISKIDWAEVPDFDLFTWSFPCTDISIAGEQKGFEEGSGTASSLAWECLKAIRVKRPKYLLMENVAQLVSQKNLALFNKLRGAISSLGYDNYTEILNAKDYGVAQNRPRVFMISVRRDLGLTYHFPRAFTLEERLRDYLEPVVDEKYYLSDKFIKGCIDHCDRKQSEGCGGGDRVPKIIEPQVLNPLKGNSNNGWHFEQQVYDPDGIARTVKAGGGSGNIPKVIEEGCRIRNLTPRECFRLMGLEDCDIDKIQSTGISNSQQYKLAGNSIAIPCLYHLFRKLFVDTANEKEQMTLF